MTSIKQHALSVILLFLLANGQGSEAADPVALETTQAELTDLVNYFLENSSTAAAHDRFWSSDLVYTSSNGTRFGKADIMAGFAEDTAQNDEPPPIIFSGEEIKVQVYGDAAVVTFRLIGTPQDGSEISEYFNTGIFVMQQGTWRAVAWQATIIPRED